MNTAVHPAPAGGVNIRQLWAAVAVLGIAVVALGASLVHIQTRPADGHMALAALDLPTTGTQEPAAAEPATALPVTTVGQGETVLTTPAPSDPAPVTQSTPPAPVRKPPSTPVARAPASPPVAPSRVRAPAAAPVPAAVLIGTESSAPMVMRDAGPLVSRPLTQPARIVCTTCGRVESVKAVERRGDTQGVGAVAGGVLGAVLGNQVGKGNGRAIATVLGAVGGGMAGNAIEKNAASSTVYQVQVRMQDGSLRAVEQASAPAVGSAVIVQGRQLRPADGAMPATPRSAPAPAFVPHARVYSSERY